MASPLQPGEVLAGRYRVERILGEGGMGVVVSAEHLMLGERVAVKFLLPESLRAPEVITRFHREARAAARIQSEHVCRVMDVGTLDGGAPYLVMEYLEGNDLARELEVRGPLPVEEAVDYVLQASVGLAEAHALGIVHRDLKPSNLFLARLATGRRLIKVLDFGIAKHGGDAKSTELTHTFSALGSAAYMSPEQVRMAKSVDARTDVWALGVVLYQLLTTRIPFEGESLFAIAAAITADAPAPLSSVRPDIPKGLEAAVHRCLEKVRDARYASLAELATALTPFGGRGATVHASRIAQALETESAAPRPPLGSSAEVAIPSAEGSSPRHAVPASDVPSAVPQRPVASNRGVIAVGPPVVPSAPEAARANEPVVGGVNEAVAGTLGSGSTWSRTGGLASTGRQSLARLLERRAAVVALSLTGLVGLAIVVAVATLGSSDGPEEAIPSAVPPSPAVAATTPPQPAPPPRASVGAPVIHSISELEPARDDIEVTPAKPKPAESPKSATPGDQTRTTSTGSTSTRRSVRTTAARKTQPKEPSEQKKPTILKDL